MSTRKAGRSGRPSQGIVARRWSGFSIVDVHRVTPSDAPEIHEEALSYGGRPGIVNLSLIESAIGRPYHGYYEGLAEMAAALLESMVKNHGFADGNKRTAWLLTEMMIRRSGHGLDIPTDEPVDDLVVAVAEGSVGFDGASTWFASRLVKVR
ncbi:type II toxin-antitoxin system death-on-curing family toxin [Jannaschia formosa]|uniref:type II toxin-antitoxin system death-on-curing family toxin n=1 Tax=Jannaschia formosa TaxID=2259592 RepID=UPI000E1BB38B|nr:type II toxin-antitoxin system death-on-curing family toxin [Jannaschia formosa]TFL19549.1 type II toxin-antitoxin system death-on-curing family toxin [Jannaschia formosa]